MALVPSAAVNEGPIFAEVDMGADSSAPTVRATVVQASTVFYDTPATLGTPPSSFFYLFFFNAFFLFLYIYLSPAQFAISDTIDDLEVVLIYYNDQENPTLDDIFNTVYRSISNLLRNHPIFMPTF